MEKNTATFMFAAFIAILIAIPFLGIIGDTTSRLTDVENHTKFLNVTTEVNTWFSPSQDATDKRLYYVEVYNSTGDPGGLLDPATQYNVSYGSSLPLRIDIYGNNSATLPSYGIYFRYYNTEYIADASSNNVTKLIPLFFAFLILVIGVWYAYNNLPEV